MPLSINQARLKRAAADAHTRRRAARTRLGALLRGLLLCLVCLPLLSGSAAANPQPGLPAAQPGLDLSTPQRSVDFFLTATREGNFKQAAYALDLRGIAPAKQAVRGPELARELRYVVDRAMWIDIATLSDEERGNPSDGALTETLGTVALNSSHVTIRLQYVPAPGGTAVWVFSRGTVAAIPDMYEAHGPGKLGEYLPNWSHRVSFLQLTLWQWIALFGIGALSTLVALITTRIALRIAARLAARTTNKFDDALVQRLRGPLRLLTATWLMSIMLELMRPSISAEGVIAATIGTLLIAGTTWLVMRVVHTIADSVLAGMTIAEEADEELVRHGQNMRVKVARQATNAVVLFVGAALALTQFEVVRKLGVSLLASAGVLTVVIGFAAQKSVGNLIAGIQISVAQPIRIGDRVRISDDVGWIEEITLTYVTMKTWDGRRRILPITYFLDNQFENWTKIAKQKTTTVLIHADHRLPVQQLRDELVRLVSTIPEWDGDVARLLVYDTTAQSMVLRATASADDAGKAFDLSCALREQLMTFLQQLEGGRYLPRTRVELPSAPTSGAPPQPASEPD